LFSPFLAWPCSSLADMFVITRHRPTEVAIFLEAAKNMLQIFSNEPGFINTKIGRSPDDVETLVIVQNWDSVGNARRGLNSSKNRVHVWPVMSSAIDEPTMFETLYEFSQGIGTNFESMLNEE